MNKKKLVIIINFNINNKVFINIFKNLFLILNIFLVNLETTYINFYKR